jgi:glucosamine--fructose-6-phosphate aminotransferase (isomerizing)
MCGIVGYIGFREAWPIIIKGLKRLEYRGYDSSGIGLIGDSGINIYKKAGKVVELESFAAGKDQSGTIGIGHTRWATHGEPSDRNSHPHTSTDGELSIIHNGIIENYATIKEELVKRGHTFNSDTDTEVLIHLIEEIYKNGEHELLEAVRLALHEVSGAYAIVVMDKIIPTN